MLASLKKVHIIRLFLMNFEIDLLADENFRQDRLAYANVNAKLGIRKSKEIRPVVN